MRTLEIHVEPAAERRVALGKVLQVLPKKAAHRLSLMPPSKRSCPNLLPELSAQLVPTKRRATPALVPVEVPRIDLIPIERVKGTLTNLGHTLDTKTVGELRVVVPLGFSDRRINAATFKALAGHSNDTLLRKAGARWEIVDDATLIDLHDRTQLFKLGSVQIYS